MTAAVGYPTLRLVRVAIGPIELGGLDPGQWRELTGDGARRPSSRSARNQPAAGIRAARTDQTTSRKTVD